jgi:hypothetical protein
MLIFFITTKKHNYFFAIVHDKHKFKCFRTYNNNLHVIILIEGWETYIQFSFYIMFSNSPNFLATKYVYVKDHHYFDAPLTKGNYQ